MSKYIPKKVLRGVGIGAVVLVLSLALVASRQDGHVLGASNGRIVYFAEDSNSNAQIYSINADGSDLEQLTHNTMENFDPSISPNGRKIAYAADAFSDGNYQIFVMNSDGTNPTQLTNDDSTYNAEPGWSADSSKLAFVRQPADNSSPSEVYTMNADGSDVAQITHDSNGAFTPTWGPNDTSLIYQCWPASTSQICTINADGTNEARLINDTNYYSSPVYSPSGSEIAFTENHNPYGQSVKIMNSDGTNVRTLTTNGVDNNNVSWSPDGSKILYDNDAGSGGNERVFYINTDGSSETAVTSDDGSNSQHASWAPIVTDSDGDGVDDAVESTAPNNGDANNDHIPDLDQANITDILNPVTNKYVVVQSSCSSNSSVSSSLAPTSYKDAAFTYAQGLLNFTAQCATAGSTATITLYYYGLQNNETFVLRKFNTTNHVYTTIPGAVFSSTTIGGQTVTEVTYQVKDGGSLDQDGSANGVIVDPVGIGAPSVGTPDTGLGGTTPFSKSSLAPLL